MKDGKVIHHAYVYCECHEDPPEHYMPITPDMYDFPCSSSFRAWTYQYCGVPDPGCVPPQPDIADLDDRIGNLEAISSEPGHMPRYYHDKLQQLEGRVLHAEAKLHEHIDKSKRKQEGGGQRILKGIET